VGNLSLLVDLATLLLVDRWNAEVVGGSGTFFIRSNTRLATVSERSVSVTLVCYSVDRGDLRTVDYD
jgi:hypothetical protein